MVIALAATSGASKDSNEGGEKEYDNAGEGLTTAGVKLKLLKIQRYKKALLIFRPIAITYLLKELAPRVGGKPTAISINNCCDQTQSGGIII